MKHACFLLLIRLFEGCLGSQKSVLIFATVLLCILGCMTTGWNGLIMRTPLHLKAKECIKIFTSASRIKMYPTHMRKHTRTLFSLHTPYIKWPWSCFSQHKENSNCRGRWLKSTRRNVSIENRCSWWIQSKNSVTVSVAVNDRSAQEPYGAS